MKKDYKINYVFLMYDIADEESEIGKNGSIRYLKLAKNI